MHNKIISLLLLWATAVVAWSLPSVAQQNRDWLRRAPTGAEALKRPGEIIPKSRIERPQFKRVPRALIPRPQGELDDIQNERTSAVNDASQAANQGIRSVPVDTRKRVDRDLMRFLPQSAIVLIRARFSGLDLPRQGTGFLAASNLVITAAHVIHNTDFGRAVEVVVLPGCFATTPGALFNKQLTQTVRNQAQLRTHEHWGAKSFRAAFDYGAILLFDKHKFKPCGQLKISARKINAVQRYFTPGDRRTIIAGFPTGKGRGLETWFARGQLLNVQGGIIRHLIDTSQGQSGSPLSVIEIDRSTNKKAPFVFGVHSRAGALGGYNVAVRVNKGFLRRVARWRKSAAELTGR